MYHDVRYKFPYLSHRKKNPILMPANGLKKKNKHNAQHMAYFTIYNFYQQSPALFSDKGITYVLSVKT